MKSAYFKKVIYTIAGSAIPSLLHFSVPYLADEDFLSLFSSPFVIFLIPIYLLCFGASIGCLSSLAGRTPVNSFLIFIACLTVIGCAHLWNIPIRHLTRTHFRECAERSKPLVAAIKAYEAKYSKPPAKLDDLVPEFLPKIPGTGIGTAPNYEFHNSSNSMNGYGRNPWILQVNASSSFFDMCHFTYLPDQDYSNIRDPMVWKIERVDDWCFLHWYIP